MNQRKMTFTLLCILLIGQHVHAVVNKASTSQAAPEKNEETNTENKADDRISNSYGVPDEYGPPIGTGPNGPAPVYGPPELVGDHGPTPVYPPPPADIPPSVHPPLISYGVPRIVAKPNHGPPKQNYGPPISTLPIKPGYGPPKVHFGPPKQHYGPPPSFPLYRPPKHPHSSPIKINGGPPQFLLTGSGISNGISKPGHGPVIPISLETYGPPNPEVNVHFHGHQNVGPSVLPVPQGQYGPPTGHLHGPPPAHPPPGVPAPPTPPDIKYDGWLPVAGYHNGHGQPTDTYGPPNNRHNSIKDSGGVQEDISDSYGEPIRNPEHEDLKTSIRDSDKGGLPPPPLPQFEPLHNENQNPGKNEHFVSIPQSHGAQHEVPKVEQLSIVKTVGFELLPSTGALTSDLQTSSIADGGSLNVGSLNHLSNSVSLGNVDAHSIQNVGNDVQVSVHAPSNNYGPPLTNVLPEKIQSGVGFPLPPLFDTYSAPPLSSYSPNGPYPAAHAGRASSSLFGFHGNSFHKHGPHHHRHHGSFRAPPPVFFSLIPPRNREPIKFRDSIPPGLFSNLHRYIPNFKNIDLNKSPKTIVAPLSIGQQLPSLNSPINFHKSSGIGNSFSNFHSLNSPIAAPHAQYGTPLSFGDFNTPAPILTYGAPNFGPATSFVSTSTGFGKNLYNNIGTSVPNTYGTPVINGQVSTGGGHDCGFQQSNGPQYSLEDIGNHPPSLDSHGPTFTNSLTSDPHGTNSLPPSLPLNHSPLPSPPLSPSLPPSLPLNHSPSPSLPLPPSLPSGPPLTHPLPPSPPLIHSVPSTPSLAPSLPPSLPLPPSLSPSLPHSLPPSPPSFPLETGFDHSSPQDSNFDNPLLPNPPLSNSLSHDSSFGSVLPPDQGFSNPLPPGPQPPNVFVNTSPQDVQVTISLPSPSQSFPDSHPQNQPLSDSLPPNHSVSIEEDQISHFKTAVASHQKAQGNFQITPSVNQLDLQSYEQQKTDLKDSYGNPIGVTYGVSEQADNSLSDDHSHSSSVEIGNILPPGPSSHPQNNFHSNIQFHPENGVSAEALTASLTMQGFGQAKNFGSNEVDASQFLKTEEGSEALSLAQGLTADGSNGFQIQGSKGTYSLQIQPADGGLGTENSDGGIRHDQVLSNGLLQDILAAIEQPGNGRVQVEGHPEAQPLHKVFSDPRPGNGEIPKGHYITVESNEQEKDIDRSSARSGENSGEESMGEEISSENGPVALFFNNQFGNLRKETRSTKSENVATSLVDKKSDGKMKSS